MSCICQSSYMYLSKDLATKQDVKKAPKYTRPNYTKGTQSHLGPPPVRRQHGLVLQNEQKKCFKKGKVTISTAAYVPARLMALVLLEGGSEDLAGWLLLNRPLHHSPPMHPPSAPTSQSACPLASLRAPFAPLRARPPPHSGRI